MIRLLRPVLAAAVLAVAPPAWADDILVKNARLYTLSAQGTLEGADLLIRDGLIAAIGRNLPEKGARVIDGTGLQVTPGLMDSYANFGLMEIGRVSHSSDYLATDKRYGAAFDITPAINFSSTLMPQNRIHGLTHAIVRPVSYRLAFAGQGSAVRLGGSREARIIERNLAVYATYGADSSKYVGGSRATAFMRLRHAFREAAAFEGSRLPPEDIQVLIALLKREKPLVVHVHRADDIRALLALQAEFGFGLVIAGASESWMVADKLAAAKVPVIVNPMNNIPSTFDRLGARLDVATLLHEKGVTVILSFVYVEHDYKAFLVRQVAGVAVAHGLPAIEAMKAMTVTPAEVFGFADRYGTLEVGKRADVVVWDGDPLELLTSATHVFIGGEVMPRAARSTRLRDRYRDLNAPEPNWYRK